MVETFVPLPHAAMPGGALFASWESFFDLPTPFNFVVVLCGIFVVGSAIGVIAKYIRDFAIYRQELAFKREMIDRGLTADEIERLIASRAVDLNRVEEDA